MTTTEDMVRSVLVENLLLLYPYGPPADEQQIRQWLSELVTNVEHHEAVAPTAMYEHALAQAVEEWKAKATSSTDNNQESRNNSNTNATSNNKKKTPQSFSLLAQLDSAMFAPRMTVEDLQAATTAEERLALFQKVAHVDDLALDWQEVLPLLQDGLVFLNHRKNSSSSNSNTNAATSSIAAGYAKLHRKWFGQGRVSTEHWSIRCDLCQNILAAIANLVVQVVKKPAVLVSPQGGDSFSAAQEELYSLWILWYDMWLDLLQQPISHDENTAGSSLMIMGQQVLFLLRDMDVSADHAPFSAVNYHPAHFLVLVDPLAFWFQAWTSRMTPPQLLSVLKASEILPDLWQRATSAAQVLEGQSQPQRLDAALGQHSVSILQSILVCTRVQWFPAFCLWENNDQTSLKPQSALSLEALKGKFDANQAGSGKKEESLLVAVSSSNNADGLSSDQLDQLFRLFFQVGITSTSTTSRGTDTAKANPLGAICAEAIEVILYGAKANEAFNGVFVKMQKQCRDRASQKGKEWFDALLADLMERVQ